ncbi:MAG: class I SAM-dependent methyltransferase [Myxococcota bacterium]
MTDELQHYYARRAREYERVYAKPERQTDLAALTTLVRESLADHDVLELACGTGWWTERVASVVRSLVACDTSDEVLEVAASKRYPDGRVTLTHADAYELDTIDGRFTATLAGFWWSHVPRPRLPQFIAGLHRRLEPGARVVFLDNRYVEGSSTTIAERDDAGNTYQRRRLDDGSTHRVLKNFPTRDEVTALLRGHAQRVEFIELPYFWCLRYDAVAR